MPARRARRRLTLRGLVRGKGESRSDQGEKSKDDGLHGKDVTERGCERGAGMRPGSMYCRRGLERALGPLDRKQPARSGGYAVTFVRSPRSCVSTSGFTSVNPNQ
jgi:hypothetical protein